MKVPFLSVAALAFLAAPMFASSVCPAPSGGSSGGEGVSSTYISDTVISGGVVQNDTGCNVLITFNAGGSISTTFPNAAPSYDSGGDDNLVGVVNNTGSAITSIALSSTAYDIFGFDGDGICGSSSGAQTTTAPGYTFVGGGNPCSESTDPSGYGGPYTLASSSNSYSGTITFGNGGIAPGGSSWFSLEGPVDVNLSVSAGTPEPASLALFGIGAGALFFLRKRKA